MLIGKKRIRFTETVLRDAHQSLMATRMKTEEMLPIIDVMDRAGYDAVECWGGATFDVCMRYLKEDPWQRLRELRKGFKHTKLQMLLRGQNLLGYRHYADDVVESFVRKSIENGIDILRIFDAFNDTRNLETAVRAAKKENAHVQLAMAYTTGSAYTRKYWKTLAKTLTEMGADSICIKDMAGLLLPGEAAKLIKEIKKVTKVPIQLHSHCTTGVAPMTYLKAIEAGCDGIDTAISPFAMGTSQPATEVMYETIKGDGMKTGLNESALTQTAEYFRRIRRNAEQEGRIDHKVMDVDTETLRYQIPGGMLSNLYLQMKAQNVQDRFGEVMKEIPKVRKELGEPPLVTPSSQIIGTQAVFNILAGERYKMASKQTKAMLRGEYGKTAKPFDAKIRKKVIGKEAVVTCRPADLLEPEMNKISSELREKLGTTENLLSYILFPQSAAPFFHLENEN